MNEGVVHFFLSVDLPHGHRQFESLDEPEGELYLQGEYNSIDIDKIKATLNVSVKCKEALQNPFDLQSELNKNVLGEELHNGICKSVNKLCSKFEIERGKFATTIIGFIRDGKDVFERLKTTVHRKFPSYCPLEFHTHPRYNYPDPCNYSFCGSFKVNSL